MIRRVARGLVWLVGLCCLAPLLAGCTAHTGGETLAFVRAGRLWTIQPDGSDLHQIAGDNIVSFAWSPDHRQLVFRTAFRDAQVAPATLTHSAADAPGDLAVVSVNGGSTTPITPAIGALARSDAWWNPSGARLIYRETASPNSATARYLASQADQPVGIARKDIFGSASIPTLSASGATVAVIDPDGNVRLGPPATLGAVVATGAAVTLPISNRPGRVLFQPGRDALLFPKVENSGVTLYLQTGAASPQALARFRVLLDAAFSPDGTLLLARTPDEFQLRSVARSEAPAFAWSDTDPGAVPYWSPDGKLLLVASGRGATLVDVAARTSQAVLAYGNATAPHATGETPDWQPAARSPWSADSGALALLASVGDTWRGARFPTPRGASTGVYSVRVAQHAAPTLLESGDEQAPSWSTLDPSATFLVSA